MENLEAITILKIQTETDLKKLAAFLRVRARHVRFEVAREMVDGALTWLEQFAAQHPGTVTVQVVRPDGMVLRRIMVTGAVAGASIGFCLGGIPGAGAGAAMGALAGAAIAHIRVVVSLGSDGEVTVLALA